MFFNLNYLYLWFYLFYIAIYFLCSLFRKKLAKKKKKEDNLQICLRLQNCYLQTNLKVVCRTNKVKTKIGEINTK